MSTVGSLGWRTVSTVVAVSIAVVVVMLLVPEDTSSPPADPPPPKTSGHAMSELVLAVWGSEDEVAAYQSVVDDYNAVSTVVDVRIRSWPDSDAMLAAIRSERAQPDLFLLPRSELAESIAQQRNRPLLDLLDARGISFGDVYPRDTLAAFSADDNLQCMPYGTSPMVIYYNTDLIDFERMEARDLPVPNEERDRWSLEAFRAAAQFASRPRRHTRGVHIEPTLQGLAPFIYSGGGQLFDDETEPSSLALSEEGNAEALRTTLEVLRDPTMTLTNRQLRRRTAVEWFRAGKLGMIAGFRRLTPTLRATQGLNFDVLPMPTLDERATVGDLTGLCVAEGPQERVEQAADFLVHMVSDAEVSQVAKTGYLVPTNIRVSFSDAFLQPGRAPANSRAFLNAPVNLPPLLPTWTELEASVSGDLRALLTRPVLEDLEAELAAIDERSQGVLSPEDTDPDEGATELDPSQDESDPQDESEPDDDPS